ncbi:MAG: hypothetical protein GY850_45605 [bacterium]|nr:hypothetical protein [bacterium]
MFKNMKLTTKLIIFYLLVGIVPAAIISIFATTISSTALEQAAFDKLEPAWRQS